MATKTTDKILKKIEKKTKKQQNFKKRLKRSKEEKQRLRDEKKWYTIRSLLGNQWANWFILIGARECGKTYSVQDHVLGAFFDPNSKLYKVPFYWMRLNDIAIKNMIMNNAAKMFEPDMVRKYHLENVKVKGDSIFIGKDLLCRVYGLSNAYNNKGAAIFDAKAFKGVNMIIDEVALEKGQRRTFDVAYNLKMQVENICRHERDNVKVFMMLNNTEDCPELLAMFGFIPIEFGVFKLKRKHCVVDYIPNNKAYDERRKGALANELDNGTGNFTNKTVRDIESLYKGRLDKPQTVVKFSKDQSDWYTIWSGNIICPYKGENRPSIAMRRYINDKFDTESRDTIIAMEDARYLKYRDVYVQSMWRKNLEIIKK